MPYYPRAIIAPSPLYAEPTPFPITSSAVRGAKQNLLLRFEPRAESDASSTNAATTTTSSSTSTRPLFPDPSSVTPSPQPSDGKGVVAKSVLEYAILAVGIVVVGFFFFQRYSRLRRNNEPLNRFFSFTTRSRSPYTSSHGRFPRTTPLSSVPPYPYSQRTRAQDTDAAGRRVGFGGLQVSDHDGFIGDKDVLPAYENAGGPPKYGDLEMTPTVTSATATTPTTATTTTPITGPRTLPSNDTNADRFSPSSRIDDSQVTPPDNDPTAVNSRGHNTHRRDSSISTPPAVHLRE